MKVSSHGVNIEGNNTTVPDNRIQDVCARVCVGGLSEMQLRAASRVGRRRTGILLPIVWGVSKTAFKWGNLHVTGLSCTVVLRWSRKGACRGMEERSTHCLLAHRFINHSFKATQLKSGSFRVTVDGVPKALDILHKEKNNLSVSKGCYEERCLSSNENLSKISS